MSDRTIHFQSIFRSKTGEDVFCDPLCGAISFMRPPRKPEMSPLRSDVTCLSCLGFLAILKSTEALAAKPKVPPFLNALKRTSKIMRSAHDKGGGRLMSIWEDDVQAVEEAVKLLGGECNDTTPSQPVQGK